MILETICVGQFLTNCYILGSVNKRAIIIDPGADYAKIKRRLDNKKLDAAFIINTHGHIDHIGADEAFGIPVYIHAEDVALLKEPKLNLSEFFSAPVSLSSSINTLQDNQEIALDDLRMRVIHTPGHTPGGICLRLMSPDTGIIFSGDTLFNSGIGRTDLALSSEHLLLKSIKEKLLVLDADTVVYPGHGPKTTILGEKRNNPFLT